MQVSAKSDYALRALIELAKNVDQVPVPADTVARSQDIPTTFLQAILADLRRAGIVRSVRGKGGGWLLDAPAEAVTIADVIRAVDGPLVSVHGTRPERVVYRDSARVLQPVWIALRSGLRDILEGVTLAHLADGALPDDVRTRAADSDAWQPR